MSEDDLQNDPPHTLPGQSPPVSVGNGSDWRVRLILTRTALQASAMPPSQRGRTTEAGNDRLVIDSESSFVGIAALSLGRRCSASHIVGDVFGSIPDTGVPRGLVRATGSRQTVFCLSPCSPEGEEPQSQCQEKEKKRGLPA